MIYSAECT